MATQAPEITPVVPNGSTTQDWRASLPEDLRAEKSIESFKDVPSLTKAFIDTKRMVGNAIHIPKDDAPQEELDKFYARLGRPESPDKYTFTKPEKLPDGVTYNEDLEKAFKTAAFAQGLHPRQAQKLLDWWTEQQGSLVTSYKAKMDEGIAALKKEWGGDFDKRISVAKKAVNDLGGDEMKTLLDDTGLGNHPAFVKFFANLGSQMGEDTLVIGNPVSADGKETIQAKITAILNDPKHPYNDSRSTHAAHEEAVREMTSLHKQLYGG